MGANVKQLAAKFVGAARSNPEARPEIFRRAADTFMGLAQDPKNTHASVKLAKIGMDFAKAAAQSQPRPPTMDDFTDLLRETQNAYDEVGDGPMDLIARRREVHDERSPLTPGHVSIAPDSFNKDATLGRSAVIKFQPTNEEVAQGIAQSQTVAFWQGVKKEAQAMSVDVGLVNLPSPLASSDAVPLNIRPFGTVEYGSDGNRTIVKFDIANGVRFNVVGNYISVNVAMGPPRITASVFDPTAQITVGASIGTFASPSLAPLIFTEYVDYLPAGGTSDFITIPAKAVQLLPIQNDLAVGETVELTFFGYGGGSARLTDVYCTKSGTAAMPPIPITGDISFVRVRNIGVVTRSFRLPFQLSL